MKRKRAGGHINTEGWMMSYADMATILLAMFIVLSTLGKDQTGISLANGTGSFVNAMSSFGLAGLFRTSARPIPMNNPTPHYLYHPPPTRTAARRDRRRVIDGEEEHLQRFLRELQRQFPVERPSRQVGQVIDRPVRAAAQGSTLPGAAPPRRTRSGAAAAGTIELSPVPGGVDADAESVGMDAHRRPGSPGRRRVRRQLAPAASRWRTSHPARPALALPRHPPAGPVAGRRQDGGIAAPVLVSPRRAAERGMLPRSAARRG